MAICPATLKPCIDDLCYGCGCLRMPGVSLLTHCACGALIGIDGTDPYGDCVCAEYDDDGYDPAPDE